MSNRSRCMVVVAAGLAAAVAPTGLAQCPMEWSPGFAARGLDGPVYAQAVFDDGRGPALYVGGDFNNAGEAIVQDVAKWDGTTWSAVGEGYWGWQVRAMCVFDDGTGPALYVGLNGNPGVRRWDGHAWSNLPVAISGAVYALAVFDDGTGPALYGGGQFQKAGGVVVWHIAKWTGQSWSPLGSGMYHFDFATSVDSLAVYDDGTGPALYAGGHFTKAGGVAAENIAKWNGQTWTPVAEGLLGGWDHNVKSLVVHDDGTGPALFAAGKFVYAGWALANGVAKWDGSVWTALGSGVSNYAKANALAVYDDGSGPALYVTGEFQAAGGQPAAYVARWDGQAWSGLDTGLSGYGHSLAVFDPPGAQQGPGLYVAGELESAGPVGVSRIARWDASGWSSLGEGLGLPDQLEGMYVYDDGAGPALYVGGWFSSAGGVPASRIAKWDGQRWHPLGSGAKQGGVARMTVFDDGTGPALYVGGYFVIMGGLPVYAIARWDGQRWSALGSGIRRGNGPGVVVGMNVFDDGTGPALYAGGLFTTAGGAPANNIAKWDGQRWWPLGEGITASGDMQITSLEVYDDGTGPALYVGGWFEKAGGMPAKNIAKWDGSRWSTVGGGINSGYVSALRVWDDGQGPALYVAGSFTSVGGVSANNIARWNGQAWSPLAAGVDGYYVAALAPFDDGNGEALYVGGRFTHAGTEPANFIARWNRVQWEALPSDLSDPVWGLASWPTVVERVLYGSGDFMRAGPYASARIGRWTCVPGWVPGDLNCDGVVNYLDVDPFVWAVIDRAQFEARFPGCLWLNGDINADNRVDFGDINPLLELLRR